MVFCAVIPRGLAAGIGAGRAEQIYLTDRGAKHTKLWVDRYEIEPQEAFTEKIKKVLEEARLIVTILSENWRGSDHCPRELDTFSKIHNDASDRFIPVLKEKIARESLPNLMQGDFSREGYQLVIPRGLATGNIIV